MLSGRELLQSFRERPNREITLSDTGRSLHFNSFRFRATNCLLENTESKEAASGYSYYGACGER
jgi:hypothetical protein